MGSPVAGTGAAITFGPETIAGTYTILGTNVATTCTADMTGSANVNINPLPAAHTVTGGGPYCSGAAGVDVALNGSNPGISYQLYKGVTATGSQLAGTGGALYFGMKATGGVYTVVATDTTTMCTKTMNGVAIVVVNVLPTAFTVTGGGIYCDGTPGAHIGLSGSNSNVHYQLWHDSTLVTTVVGSGFPIDFGAQTALGTYTVVGINSSTGCSNNMLGSAVVMNNPLPVVYVVTGGGSYCVGDSGVVVGLSGSNTSVNYQLLKGGAAIGAPVAGTGGLLNFGSQTAGSYTVVATDALAGCTSNMAGAAVITVNSLPPSFAVLGGGNYCTGGAGYHIYLSSSTPGVSYQLIMGGGSIGGLIAGTGAGVDFGLQTAPGTYTVVASNTGTGCNSNMTGSATINLYPLPVIHNVTVSDGGNYCITGTGVHVGLDGSDTGVHYQLFRDGLSLGSAMAGTGSALDFGLHNAGSYTIVATNPTTSCTSNMSGTATVNAVPLPTVYAVSGGGNYCETGLGVHVGLTGSDSGVSYQLFHSTVALGGPVTGTGAAIDFGLETASGTYTVMASNGVASCNNSMSGSAVVTVYPVIIPVVHMTTGVGDTVCVDQLVTFTASPINGGSSPVYQWYVNGTPYTAVGNIYSYVPIDGDVVTVMLTSNGTCAIPDTASMSVRMTVSPLEMPSVHVTADPGDIICQGSPVTLNATTLFSGYTPTITWLKNSHNVGSGLTYSYSPVNGDVIVVEMASTFPCRITTDVFSNTNTMMVDPSVIPIVSIAANPGTTVAPGENVTFTATIAHGGSAPTYQWMVNGINVPGATTSMFTSSTLSNNDSVTCEVVGGCALSGFNSVIVHVGATGVQQVTSAGTGDIRLIPNPNKGTFIVKGSTGNTANEEVTFEITNMLGQVVYTNKVMTQNGLINERIQLDNTLANGMYILNLHSDSQNNTFHFVIEQ